MIKGLFPGSFDPITIGHISLLRRALPLFDEIHLAIAENPDKKHMFTLADRYEWCKEACRLEFPDDYNKIKVVAYDYLTAEYCKDNHINYIIRGLRGGIDFEYENMLCHANKMVNPNLDTIYLITEHQYIGISSSIVREIFKNKGDVSLFVPKGVNLKEKYNEFFNTDNK